MEATLPCAPQHTGRHLCRCRREGVRRCPSRRTADTGLPRQPLDTGRLPDHIGRSTGGRCPDNVHRQQHTGVGALCQGTVSVQCQYGNLPVRFVQRLPLYRHRQLPNGGRCEWNVPDSLFQRDVAVRLCEPIADRIHGTGHGQGFHPQLPGQPGASVDRHFPAGNVLRRTARRRYALPARRGSCPGCELRHCAQLCRRRRGGGASG